MGTTLDAISFFRVVIERGPFSSLERQRKRQIACNKYLGTIFCNCKHLPTLPRQSKNWPLDLMLRKCHYVLFSSLPISLSAKKGEYVEETSTPILVVDYLATQINGPRPSS